MTMNERPSTNRHHVIDLLPEFALVALPDGDLRRVEAHLARCAACREAFARELESATDAAAAVEPPRSGARAEFLARTGGLRILPSPMDLGAGRVRLLPPAPVRNEPAGPAIVPLRTVWDAFGGVGLRAAAALVLVITLPIAGWFLGVQAQIDQRNLIYALVTNPAAAYPLNDSDLGTNVSGVFYATPDANTAYIAARGLPRIPDDRRYQVWLMTPAEEMVSAGFLAVSANGDGEALLTAPEPIGDYLVAVVTPEPERGSLEPTGTRTLGGWISA